jgi:hypothetical protein
MSKASYGEDDRADAKRDFDQDIDSKAEGKSYGGSGSGSKGGDSDEPKSEEVLDNEDTELIEKLQDYFFSNEGKIKSWFQKQWIRG